VKRSGLAAGILATVLTAATAGCVYFNAMYDAGQAYDAGMNALQEEQNQLARQQFDSVIAKTGRIVSNHPSSKYADDAAFLKTRAELHNKLWESAFNSADYARQLSRHYRDSALAAGLKGIAAVELERPVLGDSLLSSALEADLTADDRASVLFHRGLARLRLDRPADAAADLEDAARQIDLTREARLDLARALLQIGDYARSADVTADLLRMDDTDQLSEAGLAHIDSLTHVAPDVMDARLQQLLQEAAIRPTLRSLFQLLRGRALEYLGETDAALAVLDSSAAGGITSRWAPQASLFASQIRLRTATSPEQIVATVSDLEQAARGADRVTRETARPLAISAARFRDYTQAWRDRGGSAAEAALRSAELAGTELESPAVARGLYLKYLELAPDSPWTAKAIYGALAYSGQRPGSWVQDEGEATDGLLLARLESLPPEDPYRQAITGTVTDSWADSAYVLAEADLEERITEIRMLFDTTVVRVRRDSLPADDILPAADSIASDEAREPELDF
jgi:outer membrane protein assembly factor BamD (BamD/ComL family)